MAGYPYSENIYVKFCPNNAFGETLCWINISTIKDEVVN